MNPRNNNRQTLKLDTANTSRLGNPLTSTFTPPWSTRDTAPTSAPPSCLPPPKADLMQKPTPPTAPNKGPQQARQQQQQQPTPPNSALDDVSTIAGALVQTQELAKNLASALGRLEIQASRLSSSKAALEAQKRVQSLRELVREQSQKHEEAITREEHALEAAVLEALKGRLRDEALKNAREKVNERVQDRIQRALKDHIPETMTVDALQHEEDMVSLDVQLHNTEARRVNEILKKNDRLRPLLRPPILSSDPKNPSAALSPRAHISPSAIAPFQMPKKEQELTVALCGKLPEAGAKKLADYYNLTPRPRPLLSSSPRNMETRPGVGPTREEHINAYLEFAGAPFRCTRIAPPSTAARPVGSEGTAVIWTKQL
ncbi:hypothetical protein CYLTODRAFT_425944, partial [Cylindrobasidium torrendii FP15055 ss-10]